MNSELITSNTSENFMDNFDNSMLTEMLGLEVKMDKIKIPIGGTTSFEIPDIEHADELVPVKEIKGVILFHHPLFSYYKGEFKGKNDPPDCYSIDGEVGVGNPGTTCKSCVLNTFGTGVNGGKACKSKHKLYILPEKEIFPKFMILPTNSVQEFSNYIKALITKRMLSNGVVTKFTLKRAVNKGGVNYSKVNFGLVRKLNDSEKNKMTNLINQIKAKVKNRYEIKEDL